MKHITHRSIQLLLISVIALFMLASCAGTESTASESTETVSSVTAEMPGTPPDGAFPGEPPEGGMPGGSPGEIDHGEYALLATEDAVGGEYISTSADENAIRVADESEITLSNITVTKSGDASEAGDASNFYGLNAGILVMDSAELTISNSEVQTVSEGSNGIFSYGDAVVSVNNVLIQTTGDSAGGIMVAGGGTMYVSDSDIETLGDHSAALRTDRGGGTLVVDGGSYTSNGEGSPAVYSTAEITISNADLTANGSEAIVIEGMNSVILTDCDVADSMNAMEGENVQNVMIYQSMSGDADVGVSTFSMTGGSLTSYSGDMIYVTNTACEIYLSDVDITLSSDVLLKAVGNESERGWGTTGENGGEVTFTADAQVLSGKIIVDEISSLTLSLENGSSFTGSINSEDEGGNIDLLFDSGSSWTLSEDSFISSINSTEGVDLNGYTLYVDGNALNI